jgi:hypothetical protein
MRNGRRRRTSSMKRIVVRWLQASYTFRTRIRRAVVDGGELIQPSPRAGGCARGTWRPAAARAPVMASRSAASVSGAADASGWPAAGSCRTGPECGARRSGRPTPVEALQVVGDLARPKVVRLPHVENLADDGRIRRTRGRLRPTQADRTARPRRARGSLPEGTSAQAVCPSRESARSLSVRRRRLPPS